MQLHLIVFIWGFTAILGKLISLQALELVWLRMLIASMSILLYVLYKREQIRINKKDVFKLLGAGIIIALHWITFYHAIKISNVSITLACLSSGAFFVSIIEPILHRKLPVWYEILLGLLAVAGLGIIFGVEIEHLDGMLVALCSAFLSAFFAVLNGKFTQRLPAATISLYELSGGFLSICVYFLATDRLHLSLLQNTAVDWMYLLLLSTVCTAFAFLVSVNVLKVIPAYTMVLTINLEPIYGIILAWFIFGESEKMSLSFYLGASMIMFTLFFNAWIKQRIQRKKSPENEKALH